MRKKSRPLRVPVTHGLKDIYAMDMHLAYQSACQDKFNVTAFGRMAAALSVIRSALDTHQTRIPQAIEIIDAALEILRQVRQRGDEQDDWRILEAERPPLLQGILMAEESIGTLDVALLERAALRLLQEISGS